MLLSEFRQKTPCRTKDDYQTAPYLTYCPHSPTINILYKTHVRRHRWDGLNVEW